MESFGQILKQAREDQSLTVEDLASLTRIQEHYLRALEEDRFEALPQQVFTKGFVRTYARALNMDEDDVMRRFTIASGSHYQHEEEEQEQVKQKIAESRKGKANRNAVVVLTGLILIGLLFILPSEQSSPPVSDMAQTNQPRTVPISESKSVPEKTRPSSEVQNSSTTDRKPDSGSPPKIEPAKKPETAAPKPIPKPDGNQVASVTKPSSQPVVPLPSSAPAKPKPPVTTTAEAPSTGLGNAVSSGGESLTLNLEALEITWVVVSSDDGEPHEALLQPGEKAQWRAEDHFLVTLGNAGGVNVKVDGEPRGPFGKPGTVVRDLMIRR